jgi:hypothetical protein
VILLQRRKKYKTRTILGYKTLAEGVIRMDAVLQKSMDMTVELSDTGKNGRPGFPIATVRATNVSSGPIDQDNKNNSGDLVSGEFLKVEIDRFGSERILVPVFYALLVCVCELFLYESAKPARISR